MKPDPRPATRPRRSAATRVSSVASGRHANRTGRERRGAQPGRHVQPDRVLAARLVGPGPGPAVHALGPAGVQVAVGHQGAPPGHGAAGRRGCARRAPAAHRRRPWCPAPAGTARARRPGAGRRRGGGAPSGNRSRSRCGSSTPTIEISRPSATRDAAAVVQVHPAGVGEQPGQVARPAGGSAAGRAAAGRPASRYRAGFLQLGRDVVVGPHHERARGRQQRLERVGQRRHRVHVRPVVTGVDHQVRLEVGERAQPRDLVVLARESGAGRTGAARAAAPARAAARAR